MGDKERGAGDVEEGVRAWGQSKDGYDMKLERSYWGHQSRQGEEGR